MVWSCQSGTRSVSLRQQQGGKLRRLAISSSRRRVALPARILFRERGGGRCMAVLLALGERVTCKDWGGAGQRKPAVTAQVSHHVQLPHDGRRFVGVRLQDRCNVATEEAGVQRPHLALYAAREVPEGVRVNRQLSEQE